MVGTTVGPYTIQSKLGEGGMGEVYRARDTRLKRDVALKVLPGSFTSDPDRMARFQREAEILAALNHPHIAHIHGIEESDAVRALVMELVEGDDLADRIARGPLPLDDVLAVARQIADALESAHGQGIIHRDLKPSNIKLRPDGTVKVLDFGLAKAVGGAGGAGGAGRLDESAADDAPTISSPAQTMRGVILGTASYMSPEQAKGGVVDRRSDIWAFGCVLFEMLSGRRAFGGDSITEVLASVIKSTPDWSALPPAVPDPLRRLLARCLEKQPRRRLHDIADARVEIEALIESPDAASPAPAVETARSSRTREIIAWSAAAACAALAIWFAAAGRSAPAPTPRPVERTSLVHRVEGGAMFGAPEISPDGRRVVYSAEDRDGAVRLWLRDLDAFEARPIAGTESGPGQYPFWSPDSRWIGFFAAGKLKRMPADGGPPQPLADTSVVGGGGAWSTAKVIVFSPTDYSGLFQIPEGGGAPVAVTSLPKSGVWSHMWPSFLPDGRHFLFTARAYNRPFDSEDAGIFVGSLDSPQVARLLPDVSSARYVEPGFVLFARGGVLTAVPFDPGTRRITGDPISLDEKVTLDPSYQLAAFSVSAAGAIALRQAVPFEGLLQARWLDRRGALIGVPAGAGDARPSTGAAVSPSGRQVVYAITDTARGNSDLWIDDANGGNRRALTATREWEHRPVWSRDETRIAYTATNESGASLKVQDVKGGAATVLIPPEGEIFVEALSWSPSGEHLLFSRSQRLESGLYVWSFTTKTATRFIDDPALEVMGLFSPDGSWVAYVVAQTGGADELLAVRFPKAGERYRLGLDLHPLSWGAGGRELIVQSPSGEVSALPITIGPGGPAAGSPIALIRPPHDFGPRIGPVADHSRFLVGSRIDPEKGVSEIRLVTGLVDRLRERRSSR